MPGCDHFPSNITLKVSGMACDHCKMAVEKAVSALQGISKVEADVKEGKVEVSFDPSRITIDDIKKAIEDAGYDVEN